MVVVGVVGVGVRGGGGDVVVVVEVVVAVRGLEQVSARWVVDPSCTTTVILYIVRPCHVRAG